MSDNKYSGIVATGLPVFEKFSLHESHDTIATTSSEQPYKLHEAVAEINEKMPNLFGGKDPTAEIIEERNGSERPMKCEICGECFDPANLTSVMVHMHNDSNSALAIGIKGKKVMDKYPIYSNPSNDLGIRESNQRAYDQRTAYNSAVDDLIEFMRKENFFTASNYPGFDNTIRGLRLSIHHADKQAIEECQGSEKSEITEEQWKKYTDEKSGLSEGYGQAEFEGHKRKDNTDKPETFTRDDVKNLMAISERAGHREGLKAIAAAQKAIDEMDKTIAELTAWKESQMKIWAPVIDYWQDNAEKLGINQGECISDYILWLLKQRLLKQRI